MFPVKDIMTKGVLTVTPATPIMDAAKMLVDNRISGIPVVDGDYNLVGILSEFDVLRLLSESSVGQDRLVDEFMTRKVISFEDTATAIDVCDFFLANPAKRRLPITHEGKLVGLTSRADIVKLIVSLRHHSA